MAGGVGGDGQRPTREDELRHAFAAGLGGHPPTDRFGLDAPAGAVAGATVPATVMFCDIRNFTSLADKLEFAEVLELLMQSFGRSAQALLPHGARHLKFSGDGLVAVFLDDGTPPAPARRALSAALAVSLATHEFRGGLAQRFVDRLPAFSIGVGVHQGEVTLWRCGSGARPGVTAVGE